MKFEGDDVHFVTALHEAPRELPGPAFKPTASGVERFEDESDLHGQGSVLPSRISGALGNVRFLFTIGSGVSTVSHVTIHPTAVVSPLAQLAADVKIGPYAVIEDGVSIGAGCEIAAHAVIKRFTTLGQRNRVFEHATLGGEPQEVKFRGEASRLIVGDDNLIRENVTIHRATGEGEATRIGSRNYLMIGVHIAHNCVLEDDCIFANGTALAGHISVEDHVFLSNEVGVHQFVRLGRYAMVGAKAKIVQDVLPFLISDGNPCRVRGLNSVGLRRAGFSSEARLNLKRACHLLMRSMLPLETALEGMERLKDENVRHLVRFVRGSRRGFTREPRIRVAETAETNGANGVAALDDFLD